MQRAGYTLTELLVVVVLLGVIASIGVPMYTGYTDTAKVNVVQNVLRTIALQEQEYLSENQSYFATGASCTPSNAVINTTLFRGKQVIEGVDWNYCITQNTPLEFLVRAEEVGGLGRFFTIDHNNVTSF
jgi:prepilin-type N-terminal cleavage/methylation domain-containing protein